MNIAMIAAFRAAYGGNFIAQQLTLGKKLRALGHEMIMVFPEEAKDSDWANELIANGWHLCFLPLSDNTIKQVRKLIDLINSEKIGMLQSIFSTYDHPAAIASRICGIKHVIHVRSQYPFRSLFRKFIRNVKMRTLLKQSYVIAISEQTQKDFVNYGLNISRTTIIENGVSLDRLKEGKSRKIVRHEIGISDELVFTMMGYDVHIKGVDTAVEAFDLSLKLSETNNAILCIVVASGMQNIENYIKGKFGHLPSWLRLLPPTENIGDYYRASDVFISASRAEGFSNALVEACFMNLPVIISDIPGTKWAQEFKTSLIFETGNSADLAKAIQKYINIQHSLEALSITNSIVKEKYGLDGWVNQMVGFYKNQNII